MALTKLTVALVAVGLSLAGLLSSPSGVLADGEIPSEAITQKASREVKWNNPFKERASGRCGAENSTAPVPALTATAQISTVCSRCESRLQRIKNYWYENCDHPSGYIGCLCDSLARRRLPRHHAPQRISLERG